MNKLSAAQRQQIIDYQLGLLSEADAEQVRVLLADSQQAREFLKGLAKALEPLDYLPQPEVPVALVPLTLARVHSAAVLQDRREAGLWASADQNRSTSGRPRSLGRMPEILTMAASIALVVGLLIPAVNQWRRQALRTSCSYQLSSLGSGLHNYASANGGELPYLPEKVGKSWIRPTGTGLKRTDTSNLFLLVKLKYIKPSVSVCPGIQHDPAALNYAADRLSDFPSESLVSYSYQNMFGEFRPTEESEPGFAIIADRNPLLGLGPRPSVAQVFLAPSANHSSVRDRGQNVLYLGGSVRWTTEARAGLKNDNIWQPANIPDENPQGKQIQPLRGVEVPVSEEDSVLGP